MLDHSYRVLLNVLSASAGNCFGACQLPQPALCVLPQAAHAIFSGDHI